MNIEDLIAEYGAVELDQLPDEVRSALEREPEALAQFIGQRDVALLLSLKQYEKPEAEVDERLRFQVRGRIAAGDFPSDEVVTESGSWMRWAGGAIAVAATLMVTIVYLPDAAEPEPLSPAPSIVSVEAPEVVNEQPKIEFLHVDAFKSVATAEEELSPELLEKMEESALAHSLMLRSETNAQQERFILPSMREGLQPVSLPNVGGSLLPVSDGPPR